LSGSYSQQAAQPDLAIRLGVLPFRALICFAEGPSRPVFRLTIQYNRS
jgi:hypothetical protein